jgi:hypothetical protein
LYSPHQENLKLRVPNALPSITLTKHGFVFDHTVILNPTLSDCGRFIVDPADTYGFEVIEIGAGCTALRLDADKGYVLLSDEHASHDIQILPNEPFKMTLLTDDDEVIEELNLTVGNPPEYGD